MIKYNLDNEQLANRAKRRFRWFGYHILIYFVLMGLVILANLFLFNPIRPLFIIPLVAWGAPLAVHAAFAMGLMENLLKRD